jgi:hypothetical protein
MMLCAKFSLHFSWICFSVVSRLEPGSILGLHDLYIKITSHFNINILAKKGMIKVFSITKWKDKVPEHIFRYLTRKCSSRKIYSNLLSLRPWSMESITIDFWSAYIFSMIKLLSLWNKPWRFIFEYKK